MQKDLPCSSCAKYYQFHFAGMIRGYPSLFFKQNAYDLWHKYFTYFDNINGKIRTTFLDFQQRDNLMVRFPLLLFFNTQGSNIDFKYIIKNISIINYD